MKKRGILFCAVAVIFLFIDNSGAQDKLTVQSENDKACPPETIVQFKLKALSGIELSEDEKATLARCIHAQDWRYDAPGNLIGGSDIWERIDGCLVNKKTGEIADCWG